MNASLTKAVSLFAAPLSQSARLIEALRAKVEAEGGLGPRTPQDAPRGAGPAGRGAAGRAADSTTPQDVATGGDTA